MFHGRYLLFSLATLFLPCALVQAEVAIFSGLENQATRESAGPSHGFSRISRYTARVHFVYDLESGRSVEIRHYNKSYSLREERNLVPAYAATNESATVRKTEAFLSDGKRVNVENGTIVSNVTWQGSKRISATAPFANPATGLPSAFPTVLSSRLDKTVNMHPDQEFYMIFTRRSAVVSLNTALTKASNDANESFDAALQRLKDRLNSQGNIEEPMIHHLWE